MHQKLLHVSHIYNSFSRWWPSNIPSKPLKKAPMFSHVSRRLSHKQEGRLIGPKSQGSSREGLESHLDSLQSTTSLNNPVLVEYPAASSERLIWTSWPSICNISRGLISHCSRGVCSQEHTSLGKPAAMCEKASAPCSGFMEDSWGTPVLGSCQVIATQPPSKCSCMKHPKGFQKKNWPNEPRENQSQWKQDKRNKIKAASSSFTESFL